MSKLNQVRILIIMKIVMTLAFAVIMLMTVTMSMMAVIMTRKRMITMTDNE